MADSRREYEFVCTECGQRFEVNASMRDALLERGCPVCTATVATDAFTGATPS
ncbi:FmdB family zinc ribbon protein [Haloferax sp. S1W]|uniref:DUF7560 family zinc ribbon protein n=1 Tax=Haloferax sp. S1W TaxID=3377110 RepID=UPI0037CCBC71